MFFPSPHSPPHVCSFACFYRSPLLLQATPLMPFSRARRSPSQWCVLICLGVLPVASSFFFFFFHWKSFEPLLTQRIIALALHYTPFSFPLALSICMCAFLHFPPPPPPFLAPYPPVVFTFMLFPTLTIARRSYIRTSIGRPTHSFMVAGV